MFTKLLLIVLLCTSAVSAQDTRCLTCHTSQATQPATAMANALDAPNLHPLLNSHPKLTLQTGPYSYSVTSVNGVNTYSVTDGSQTISLPVRWAFGVHSQTWLLENQGKFYESMVSFYDAVDGLDVTLGDDKLHPHNLAEAVGREVSSREVSSCFQCHSTGAVTNDQIHLDQLTPGIKCAHCHVNTSEHFQAISHGSLAGVPPKLKQMTSEDISSFCGQCHRSFSDVVRGRLFGTLNVRFQPYRLARSKCFNGADTRIGCTGCHNPHQELARADVTYETKCLACHASSATGKPASAKLCATGATTGCVGCHMPKVQLPGGHQTFTDHYIRIVRAGEKYPE